MIKNYADSLLDKTTKPFKLQPKKEIVSFILNFSKSLNIVESTVINEIRFDKN